MIEVSTSRCLIPTQRMILIYSALRILIAAVPPYSRKYVYVWPREYRVKVSYGRESNIHIDQARALVDLNYDVTIGDCMMSHIASESVTVSYNIEGDGESITTLPSMFLSGKCNILKTPGLVRIYEDEYASSILDKLVNNLVVDYASDTRLIYIPEEWIGHNLFVNAFRGKFYVESELVGEDRSLDPEEDELSYTGRFKICGIKSDMGSDIEDLWNE